MLKVMKKILFSTVCGPFGMDSDDCSKHVMPELFHAQVTRAQGIFSLRSTYVSYGLEYIANNINTPAVVMQYPSIKQFKNELKKKYDYIGISFVIATFEKMKKMSKFVREIAPHSKIILGGYGTVLPECEQYGDFVCREEGVGFMRRLLGEVDTNEPKKHVIYPTIAKISGFPIMKGAVVLAGLGCPNGCEFCTTSHFYNMKHIPLLQTGTDLYKEIRRIQKSLGNRNLPIGIIEEDFLLQKNRALEYLECVTKDQKTPSPISCFASAYSISQWNPEDLVKMGIEVIWIGVESKNANYSKLKGIDVKKILDQLHSYGINTLASLIIGHDFHTVESVWNDLNYLISLKPSLSQILILTPSCSTPLFERLNIDGRLLDGIPHKHWDGFHLVFDHPHISKQEMEQLIIDIYDEEYRILGPSAIRFIEKKLNGYRKLKNSEDPLLLKMANRCKLRCLEALPLFSTAIRYAPSSEVAQNIKDIKRSIISDIGTGGLKNLFLSPIVSILALVEKFKLSNFSYPQVKLKRTRYKLSMNLMQPFSLRGNGLLTIKPRIPFISSHTLIVDLHGTFTKITGKKLKKRIQFILNKNIQNLAINFRGVTFTERDALFLFLKKLRVQKNRIKIISIETLRADLSDVVIYAKKYFEVYDDVDSLTASYS